MHFLRWAAFGLTIIALNLAGCTKSPKRVEVSGSVKLKGEPIKEGTVAFIPLEDQPTGATAMINNGTYVIPGNSGLMPGKYLVRVSAGDGRTPANQAGPDNQPGPSGNANILSKDLIPREWNVDSQQERTVTSEKPNQFDFDIP